MKKIDNFVNLYPVTKTLRFKLIPVGRTKENFDKNKLLDVDKERAENYKRAKLIIDKYYNEFINNCLNNFKFKVNPDNLKDYYEVLNSELDKKEKDIKLKELQSNLRKEIVSSFSNTESKKLIFDKLFKGDLLNEILDDNRITNEEKKVISKFNRFTTYFQGFFQNRKNAFSDEDKPGSISYRLVNENLKSFVNNIRVYFKIKEVLKTQVYSQGALLYSPDKRIERKLEPVTIGAGESDDGIMYNVELGSNTPIWVSSLLGRGRNTYKTSNSKVVKVDNKKSVITGVKTGKATVKVVSSLGVEISRQVIVKKAPSRISLSKSKMTLIIDDFFDSYQEIRAKLPSGTASRYLTWKSSNPSVAKYDEDHGTIEAKSPGIATITVKTYNGKKASCKVTVKAPEPTMLDLRTDSLYLHIKETFKLVPVIDEGASTTFSYSSKNPKIATVSSKGVITGKKKGTTRIIVKTANGLKETVTVEVSGKKKKDDRLYESGISGIRVFAALSDQFFHSNKTCSKYQGGTYSRVTLETALNYGKEPCPVCSPEARKTVYALEGGSYCHRDKSHAGSKAKKYTYAAAKARGMNVCPICGYE